MLDSIPGPRILTQVEGRRLTNFATQVPLKYSALNVLLFKRSLILVTRSTIWVQNMRRAPTYSPLSPAHIFEDRTMPLGLEMDRGHLTHI